MRRPAISHPTGIISSPRAADFEHEASNILTSFGFKLTHRLSADKPPMISLQAKRRDGDFERRYGIELKLIVDGKIAGEAIDRFNLSTEEDHEVFDEYWLIASQASSAARVLFDGASSRYQIYTLSELTRVLSKPRKRPPTLRPRTKVGKAVGVNRATILATIAALVQLIDERISAEETERPNSDEAIQRRDATIAALRTLREKLADLAREVRTFVAGQTKEPKVVKSVNSFADGVQAWWEKGSDQIIQSTFGTAVFTVSVSICSLAGVSMHGKTVALIAGALAGGKPLVDVLKGLGKTLFK